MSHRLCSCSGRLPAWLMCSLGLLLGCQRPCPVLVEKSSVGARHHTSLNIEESLGGVVDDDDVHVFVADVVQSFHTLDRNILESVGGGVGVCWCVLVCGVVRCVTRCARISCVCPGSRVEIAGR